MTNKEKFVEIMTEKGFTISDNFFGRLALIPNHRKTTEGHHNIISGKTLTIFDGSDTPEGELGCVCFHYHGVQRYKYHRTAHQSKILNKSFCPKSVKEAVDIYDKWSKESWETIKSWKVIL